MNQKNFGTKLLVTHSQFWPQISIQCLAVPLRVTYVAKKIIFLKDSPKKAKVETVREAKVEIVRGNRFFSSYSNKKKVSGILWYKCVKQHSEIL